VNIPPCDFWRAKETQYPILATLARDIFSIPATGAGVERLFNSARDICNYRRGSLNATIIQDLMMFRCLSRFDIEKDDLTPEDPALTLDERQAEDELKEAQFTHPNPDPISDDEEDIDLSALQDIQPAIETRPHPNDKPPQNTTDIQELEENRESENEPDLPPPHTQQRTSQRVRKRSRRGDEEYY
jgi:hypothetical protein